MTVFFSHPSEPRPFEPLFPSPGISSDVPPFRAPFLPFTAPIVLFRVGHRLRLCPPPSQPPNRFFLHLLHPTASFLLHPLGPPPNNFVCIPFHWDRRAARCFLPSRSKNNRRRAASSLAGHNFPPLIINREEPGRNSPWRWTATDVITGRGN